MLSGRKALVTGASRGIGFAIAKELASVGCNVIITGRKEATLKEAAEKIGKNAIPLVWDASDISIAEAKITEAAKILGGLDIVVNNAGIFVQRSEWNKNDLLKTTVEQWETVIKTNTSSVFFTMQAAVKYMLKNNIKGNILNITSAASYEPVFGAYGTSKMRQQALQEVGAKCLQVMALQ